MKLKNSRQKRTLILIVLGGVLLACIIGLLISVLIPKEREEGTIIYGIQVSSLPDKTEYYIGDAFDPTGTKIQIISNKLSSVDFIDYRQLTFSGFDSSVVSDKVIITVTYQGYTTSFDVKIKEKPAEIPVLTSIRLSDNFKTTYTLSSWLNKGVQVRDVNLICTYSDGTEKSIPMQKSYISGVDKTMTGPCETSFIIRYSEGGVQVETTITVRITN